MEGTISTVDEILKFEADSENDSEETKNVRSEMLDLKCTIQFSIKEQ